MAETLGESIHWHMDIGLDRGVGQRSWSLEFGVWSFMDGVARKDNHMALEESSRTVLHVLHLPKWPYDHMTI
jgi:hypothetical protein